MVFVPQPEAHDLTTRDPDRVAVLVGYTLLGAAINGFMLEVPVALDRCRRAAAVAG